jgi:hypothetical protein
MARMPYKFTPLLPLFTFTFHQRWIVWSSFHARACACQFTLLSLLAMSRYSNPCTQDDLMDGLLLLKMHRFKQTTTRSSLLRDAAAAQCSTKL